MNQHQRILIVEDEPDAAQLLELQLRRRGFETIVMSDGTSALEATYDQHPDLIILDVMLPQLSGLEVCHILRSDSQTERIPILLVSALATGADKLRGFGCGADDYLSKPYDMAELIVRVYALLRRAASIAEPLCHNMN